MKHTNEFEELLDKLKFNPNIMEIYNNEISESEKAAHTYVTNQLELINKEIIFESPYRFSSIYPWFVLIQILLYNADITRENYKAKAPDSSAIDFFEIYFKLIDKIAERKIIAERQYQETCILVQSHPKLNDPIITSHQINILKISSVFADYYFIKDINNVAKHIDNKLVKEFRVGMKSAKMGLYNAILLNGANVDELDGEIVKGNISGLRFGLDEFFVNKLKIPLELVKELNDKIFENTLSKEILEAIYNFVKEKESDLDFSFLFAELHNVFKDEVRLSVRAKKLLLHDIFKIYEHPRAITDKEEELYFQKDENSSLETLEKRKIRVAEALVPDLK